MIAALIAPALLGWTYAGFLAQPASNPVSAVREPFPAQRMPPRIVPTSERRPDPKPKPEPPRQDVARTEPRLPWETTLIDGRRFRWRDRDELQAWANAENARIAARVVWVPAYLPARQCGPGGCR